jgi:hypothetical protein
MKKFRYLPLAEQMLGVHAFGQVGHFDTVKPAEVFEKWDLAWGDQIKVASVDHDQKILDCS